ncbi:hypothetical protein V6N13_096024 [Hibiscus sabdariffa]|uniref:Bifunctional inhibitor/plant lipid transfer protein/seed storage helical domain-containing protein n=1 Tax=Hibiscus sabdariffa TaxID=183260 RepID=A0ABR2DIK8_9ROSI
METKCLALVVLVVVAAAAMWEVEMAAAELSAAQCKQERDLAITACKPVVYGKLPSPECCQRVRVTHLECVCPVITSRIAALIDVNRAVRLIQGCGRSVPRHYKCGSITTP